MDKTEFASGDGDVHPNSGNEVMYETLEEIFKSQDGEEGDCGDQPEELFDLQYHEREFEEDERVIGKEELQNDANENDDKQDDEEGEGDEEENPLVDHFEEDDGGTLNDEGCSYEDWPIKIEIKTPRESKWSFDAVHKAFMPKIAQMRNAME